MRLSRAIVWMLSAGVVLIDMGVVSGQAYPNRPIRIVTTNVGGGNDFVARLVAQGITGPLGQPVIVENRPAGPLAGEIVSKAIADGYTLLVSGGNFWIGPLMQQKPSYDPIRDFSAITLAESAPNALVVHPSMPVNSVKELIALAKSKPGELNYASTASGGSPHLTAELFKSMAGINIVRIPYKGAAPALADLMGGQVQLMFTSTPTAAPHTKSGKLKALAVTSPQPSPLAPGLPTVAATGLPGFEAVTITGIFAPANVPQAVINRLNQEIVRFLRTAEAKEKFFNTGAEVVGSSPEELAIAVKAEVAKWGKVIKDGNIRSD